MEMMKKELLQVERMNIRFHTERGTFRAVKDVSFTLKRNEIVGLVGESGCGKSVTSQALIGLLPSNAECTAERLQFEEAPLGEFDERAWLDLRGNRMAMIFQEPLTTLNPLLTVGRQISEGLIRHQRLTKKQAKERALQVMRQVELPRPEQLYDEYPHQLSGGMRQRIVIAMALVCNPQLLIADEPTTALDVTVQANIIALLKEIHAKQQTSILFISHDLAVIFDLCQRIIVMYAGYIVEEADKSSLQRLQRHPYTKALIGSLPSAAKRGQPLQAIPGSVPSIQEELLGCPFAPRCSKADERCRNELPELVEICPGHFVRCHYADREAIQ
ncbi:ABC transporter ATP-binding protein [Paenibacillus sp. GCM10027626]|uniref:ABC transporter ATP-binding protein n=1 Tax=Paenibacillus sp. GCM10027626 TaxID=3273411 RepID=UPI0036331EBC